MQSTITVKEWLQENPFVLALSSGYFGFFSHTGFVKALEEAKLKPIKFSGASAGSLITAALASEISAKDIEKIVTTLKTSDILDPGIGFGYIKGKRMEAFLKTYLGVTEFSHLKSELQVSVFDILERKTKSFKEGDLLSVLRASCAVPVMFHAVKIQDRYYWDGGLFDKAAVSGLRTEEKVFGHYLFDNSLMSRLELQINRKRFNPNQNFVISGSYPSSGLGLLHKGPEIIEKTYQQTKLLLDQPLTAVSLR